MTRGQWIPARHQQLIDLELVKVALGQTKRLIVEAPPRHGKSILISKWFPAWYVGSFPNNRCILTAYGDTFASSWGKKARDILEEHGQKYFGIQIDPRSKAANNWNILGKSGGMITAGTGGQIVGYGANLLIIDDPIKSAQEADSEQLRENLWDWFQSGAMSRLEPNASVVILMQRWHIDDIVGRLKREQPDEWKVITLPAIAEIDDPLGRQEGEALWPERKPVEELLKIQSTTNRRWWNAQYQQRPTFSENAEWPEEYFENITISKEEFPTDFEVKVLALDPSKGKDAKRGDYSAIVFAGLKDGTVYIDSNLKRRPIPDMVEDTLDFYVKYRPDTLGIETNLFQSLLVQVFEQYKPQYGIDHLDITEQEHYIKKQIRIRKLDPYLKNKEIVFKDTESNRIIINQLKEFPQGNHDDGPDALAMAIELLREYAQTPMDDGLGDNLLRNLR